jgi:hypothetical protein
LALLVCGVFAWRGALAGDDGAARRRRRNIAFIAYFGVIVACWSVVALENGFDPLPEVRSMLGPLFLIAAYQPRLVPKHSLLDVYSVSAIAYHDPKTCPAARRVFGRFQGIRSRSGGRSVFDMELVAGPLSSRPAAARASNDLAVAMFPLLLLDERYRDVGVRRHDALRPGVLSSYSRYLMLAFIAVSVVAAWQLVSSAGRGERSWLRFLRRLQLRMQSTAIASFCVVARGKRCDSDADAVPPMAGRAVNVHADSIRKEQFARLKG